jgi:hypothetical protein
MSSSLTGSKGMGGVTGGDKVPKGYTTGQLQQFSPEQMQLFQQLFSHVGPESFTSKLAGGDQSQFEQLEAPAMRQFQGLQGNIASRFSGMGTGARRSSGFQNTINQASSDFASDLASRRMGLQQQAIQDLMGMSSQLLGQRPQERMLAKRDMPFWKQLTLGGAEAGSNFVASRLSGG